MGCRNGETECAPSEGRIVNGQQRVMFAIGDAADPRASRDYGQVRRDHPATSRRAARSAPVVTGQQRVMLVLQDAGDRGLTDQEIADALGMSPSTARPRRVELVRAGWVISSGRERPSALNRAMTVWVATDAGRGAGA